MWSWSPPAPTPTAWRAWSAPERRAAWSLVRWRTARRIKQNPDGRIVTGLDYRPGAAGVDVSQAYGESLLANAALTVPGIAGAKLEKMTLGYVPIPKDVQPIVGFCDAPRNLYIVLTMSGITMAPLMGRLAATEIAGGVLVDTLAPFRPARFT
jgi:glycine/D-amino acid oxidase-like deaminating enzyme